MRPQKCRYIDADPRVRVFKPRGIPSTQLEVVQLALDEWEALRLADAEGLHHELGGQHMGVSRATFGRILERARQKVADALVHGKCLEIAKNNVRQKREK